MTMLDPAQPFIQSNQKVAMFCKNYGQPKHRYCAASCTYKTWCLREIILFNHINYDNKYNIL